MEIVALLIGVAVCAAALVLALRLRPSKRLGTPRKVAIDPFGVGEPWRHHVAAAQSAQRRYAKIVEGIPDGPLRTRMAEIGRQVEHGVVECWEIAKRGHQLDGTIRSLDGASVKARLAAATDDGIGASLQSQADSIDRVRSARDETDHRLRALHTRLGELVSQAAEVSIGADHTAELGSAVNDVVVQLEALSQAVDEVNTTGRSRGFEAGGQGTATA